MKDTSAEMNRLWIWLAGLNDKMRNRLGASLIFGGLAVLFVGLLFAHGGLLADDAGYLESIPREIDFGGEKPNQWIVFTFGQLVAFVGSQIILAGVALRYIAGHKLTWARAGFAAFIAFFELILLWGVVPSEWLNLTQGPLGWTKQDIVFTVPGTEIGIAGYYIKDAVAGGYHIGSLAVVIYFAVMVQKWGKMEAPASTKESVSQYGRPLKASD